MSCEQRNLFAFEKNASCLHVCKQYSCNGVTALCCFEGGGDAGRNAGSSGAVHHLYTHF